MIARALGLLAAITLLAGCAPAAEDWPAPTPALWRVTAPSGQAGWLFGTIHALPDGAEWRTPALDAAAEQSGVLIVEIADPGAGGAELFEQLAHTPGQAPLSSRIPPDQRDELAAVLARNGQTEGDFTTVETWAAALMLDSGAGGDPANGADLALVRGAKNVRALETRAGQLRMFDRLPQQDQAALLASALAEAAAPDPQAGIRAWLAGDMETLDRLANAGLLANASLRQTLLTARNAAWLGPITAAIDRGERPLVAVGAVHMAGADGLPALLAARGYKVTRVQ